MIPLQFEKILSEKHIDAFNGAQGRILYVLWQEDGITIRSLSIKCGLAITSLTTMLERMENQGLIRRVLIGDPFWTVMETEQDSDKNTGNYEMVNDSILLFLSKKQAINYCSKIKKSAKVFGISQNHLKVLVSLQEKSMFPDFSIAIPEFEQLQENSILCYTIPHKSLKKFYLRGDNNE